MLAHFYPISLLPIHRFWGRNVHMSAKRTHPNFEFECIKTSVTSRSSEDPRGSELSLQCLSPLVQRFICSTHLWGSLAGVQESICGCSYSPTFKQWRAPPRYIWQWRRWTPFNYRHSDSHQARRWRNGWQGTMQRILHCHRGCVVLHLREQLDWQ